MTHSKYYIPSDHLAVYEVIVLLKGHVIFRQYIPKMHRHFRIKIYKLCDMSGYTYDTDVYLAKVSTCMTADMTATHNCETTNKEGGRTRR
jgi:hypothetical protein